MKLFWFGAEPKYIFKNSNVSRTYIDLQGTSPIEFELMWLVGANAGSRGNLQGSKRFTARGSVGPTTVCSLGSVSI